MIKNKFVFQIHLIVVFNRQNIFIYHFYLQEVLMKLLSLEQELSSNAYPGRGIVLGLTPDGTHAIAAYFIMGRSVNSRNRVFVEDGEGIRTQAFDPSKLSDPSLIIYAPVRVLGNKTIVTNGDQTAIMHIGMDKMSLTSFWVLVSEGVTMAGIRVTVIAL